MSMEKAIASGKEHRKKYRGSKAFSCSCRNHGTCDYCKGNRLYKFNKKIQKTYLEDLFKLTSIFYDIKCSRGIIFKDDVTKFIDFVKV